MFRQVDAGFAATLYKYGRGATWGGLVMITAKWDQRQGVPGFGYYWVPKTMLHQYIHTLLRPAGAGLRAYIHTLGRMKRLKRST